MTSSEIKAKAREQLNGKKKNAAIVLILYGLIVGVINSLLMKIFPGPTYELYEGVKIQQMSVLGQLIDYVLTVFFGLGFTSYYMKLARGEEAKFDEIFSKGKILPKAIVISLLGGILIGLGFVAFIIPGILLCFGYIIVEYIYIDNPEIGIVEVLKKSREMMKGHKWQFFCLCFSFIGWIILGVFTLGILYLWLMPYMGVSQAVFYDSLKENKEVAIEE